MNVNLQEHQRSILAAMGIDLWISKADVEVRQFESTLYRDVQVVEAISSSTFEFANHDIQPVLAEPKQSSLKVQATSAEVSLLKVNPNTHETEEISNTEQIQQQTSFNVEPAIQIDAFELQAYCIDSCIILVDCTVVSDAELALWSNIQRALSGQYFELKWPFPILEFQDGKGASLYIQGFIDALRQDHKVISLGRLPHFNSADCIQLASLKEMIEQPILKRRLWQFMQNKMN